MRVYWDSTALMNAVVSLSVLDRLDAGDHITRSHSYVEAFHHLSGKGIPLPDGSRLEITPSTAAAMMRHLSQKVQPFDLDREQTLQALERAQSAGVSGRIVHDWVHVYAAKIAGAELVLTRDLPMMGLCAREGLKHEWP